jgi:hypothetical protein
MLAREDVKVDLHALDTKIKHFWMWVWPNCHVEKLHLCQGTTSGTLERLPEMFT